MACLFSKEGQLTYRVINLDSERDTEEYEDLIDLGCSVVVQNLDVKDSHQRKGAGSALLKQLRADFPQAVIGLFTNGDLGLRTFYEKNGFTFPQGDWVAVQEPI